MTVKLKAIIVLIALVLCVSLISGAFALYSTDGSLIISFAGEVSEPTSRTVYFYDASSWHTSGTVYAYAWESNTSYNKAYPGVEMNAVDGYSGWYSIDIDNKYTSVVFNSNDDSKKTADLTINENNLYYNGSSWGSSKDRIMVYYCNINAWSNVHAYIWKDGGSDETDYPGNGMTHLDGYSNMYYYTVSLNYDMIIFNNGSGDNQTGNLSIDRSNYCYDGNNWTTLERVYYKNNNSWSSINAHHWNKSNTSLSTVWSGDSMFALSNNWYFVYVPKTHDSIIFSNSGSNQTADLTIDYSNPYYSNGWVSSMS